MGISIPISYQSFCQCFWVMEGAFRRKLGEVRTWIMVGLVRKRVALLISQCCWCVVMQTREKQTHVPWNHYVFKHFFFLFKRTRTETDFTPTEVDDDILIYLLHWFLERNKFFEYSVLKIIQRKVVFYDSTILKTLLPWKNLLHVVRLPYASFVFHEHCPGSLGRDQTWGGGIG